LKLRAELGIGADEFVIGSVGRLDPVKNHQGLIRAVQILQQRGFPVRLVIVGDGPMRGDVEDCLRTARLVPEALLLGYRSDVDRLYRVFDSFVLNSFAEGMSNTLLEAMASGLPIICTAVGGNVELVENRQRGTLIVPGNDNALADAMEQLMSSSGGDYGANARSFIMENLSIRRMIERYTALYESVA
jgi:glycosyltransferase involved in cell wall biosynthesis